MVEIYAKDLIVGHKYFFVDTWRSGSPVTFMGLLTFKGDFEISGNGNKEPSALLMFQNDEKIVNRKFDWDDKFIED